MNKKNINNKQINVHINGYYDDDENNSNNEAIVCEVQCVVVVVIIICDCRIWVRNQKNKKKRTSFYLTIDYYYIRERDR